MCDRGEVCRGLNDFGQGGAFGGRQLVESLVEVEISPGRNAVAAVAHRNLVRIEREDLFFRIVLLDIDGIQSILDLALPGLFGTRKSKFRQLHGQSRSAASLLPFHEIPESGSDDRSEVETGMFKEILVFGGQDRLSYPIRNLFVGHENPLFLRKLADDPAVR